MKKYLFRLIAVAVIASSAVLIPQSDVLATAATTSLTVTKYYADGTTIIQQTTIDYTTMESTLPVQGDGTTHYFMEGPNFSDVPAETWDASETGNLKDKGAVKGTDVKDLCGLVGGMSASDSVQIHASDGLFKTFTYSQVYAPDPRQGKIVICWYCVKSASDTYNDGGDATGYVTGSYPEGMQLVFFADTSTNPYGWHIFGDQDMHDCWPESQWYLYSGQYPSSNGDSVKYINQINITSTTPPPHTIVASAGVGGSITPSGNVTVADGANQTFTVTANDGYQISGVLVDNATVGTVTSYTFNNVTANHTISASFSVIAPTTYTITASAGAGGAISPSGAVVVNSGANQTFTITPNAGYAIATLTVDNATVTPVVANYTFTNVVANHTICATFMPTWDLNKDHACNIGDVVMVGLYWGETGASGWLPEDLNNDGVINIGDVVVLGLHWGQTW